MRKAFVALYLIPILVAVDIGTKFWALETMKGFVGAIPLVPGLSLRLVFNPGVSFGLFAGSPWPVALVTAAMTATLVIWFARSKSDREPLAIGCIIAGAASNLIDRLLNGAVTDFLSFGSLDTPLFTNNLADVWITLGVILLFGGALLDRRTTYAATRSKRP
ncbi:signal peptidase II [Devosia naphthalenivorans]|uniref:signal peptidase II n=1 Tax=Devosia naphthalenivorans TaxID=2082392 RepID=UPI0013B0590F|nr:signal peptidase II [Devosia naphthalenivorans]